MAKTIQSTVTKNSIVVWQEPENDNGAGEPALLITPYFGTICIEQGSNSININYETVAELCKLLKSMREPQ